LLHIDLPSRTEIEKLAAYRGAPAVTIYVRTTPLTQDAKADRIELKNLLKTAVSQLDAAGADKRGVRSIEAAVEAIIEDDDFWAVQANSLAIFATDGRIQSFRLPNKLANTVEVSDRFHLKPLLRAVTFPHHAYVLAIGVGSVRLVEVSAELPPHAVQVPGLPRSLKDALGRRSHTAKDGPGRSGESTSEHATFTRYARAVDLALRGILKGESAPLLIAATEPMASIFRNASSYPHVAAQVISGSADDTADHVLAEAARKVLDEINAQEIARIADLFAARANDGRATTDIAQAARAATFGAVDTLIVDMDNTVSGFVDETTGAVTFDAAPDAVNYGVVDEIARRVLQTGGRVLSARRADVPRDADLAAILRYPV
jgi:hypothetical protein